MSKRNQSKQELTSQADADAMVKRLCGDGPVNVQKAKMLVKALRTHIWQHTENNNQFLQNPNL